ncbi:tight adherence pilus pseudopilin TadF [Enterovibrio norvegicus]|uniref:tight adherence pilus pseudopilin TadF n=1 Tax=Enterovibrio norvegicus TaxID=188144 RepID=UPI00352F7D69
MSVTNSANNFSRERKKIRKSTVGSIGNQKGVFFIELCFVLTMLSVIIFLTIDIVVKQSVKGKLDRLSYSLVSVLRERSQLFDGDETMTYDEATKSLALIQNSLRSTLATYEDSRLGLLIEQQRFDANKNEISQNINEHIFAMGSYPCNNTTPLSELIDLSPVTQFDNKLTLYQVTLCYETENLFGRLFGGELVFVRSTALSFGR